MLLRGVADRRPYKWQTACDLPRRPTRYGAVVRSGRRNLGRHEMIESEQQGIAYWIAVPTITICMFMAVDPLIGEAPSQFLCKFLSAASSGFIAQTGKKVSVCAKRDDRFILMQESSEVIGRALVNGVLTYWRNVLTCWRVVLTDGMPKHRKSCMSRARKFRY